MTSIPRTDDPTRRTAFVAGALYLITFLSSIPAALLLAPLTSDPNYMVGPGADAQASWAAVLDLVNALAAIGTAVAVFSVVRRHHEGLALGFVTTRMFEAAIIVVGVLSVLTVVTLRQAAAVSGDAESVLPVGRALFALRDWTFLVGPGMASLNALMFATLLYRARLVPRAIPALGIIGAPLLISYVIGSMVGLTGPGTVWQAVAVGPFFFWELIVGFWMLLRGFNRTSPLLVDIAADRRHGAGAPGVVASPQAVASKAGAA